MSEKKAKIIMTVMASVVVLVIAVVLVRDLIKTNSSNGGNNKEISKDNLDKENSNYDKKIGIVVQIKNDKSYVIKDYQSDEEYVFSSESDVDIRNEYGKSVDYTKLIIGDVVEIGYDEEYEALKYIYLKKDVVRYKELENFILGENNKYLKVDDTKYRLSEDTYIYNNGERITVYDLNEKDIINVNIIDKEVISVNILRGHGFINLTNFNNYIGNTLIINDEDACDIEEEMKVVVIEGDNTITIKTDKLKGSKVISVKRGQTVNVDVSKMRFEKKKEGKVTFEIEPKNARLYINGKSYYSRDNLVLDYGSYNYNVELAGYDSIVGKVIVDEATKIIKLQLQEKATATPSPSPSPKATPQVEDDEISESEEPEE